MSADFLGRALTGAPDQKRVVVAPREDAAVAAAQIVRVYVGGEYCGEIRRSLLYKYPGSYTCELFKPGSTFLGAASQFRRIGPGWRWDVSDPVASAASVRTLIVALQSGGAGLAQNPLAIRWKLASA